MMTGGGESRPTIASCPTTRCDLGGAAPSTRPGQTLPSTPSNGALATSTASLLTLDGLDMTEPFVALIRSRVDGTVRNDVLERARVERLIADVAPDGILMTQEGHRTGWLAAGAAAGIPTFALQHGILYPTHPGYADRRHPGLRLATRTFVFGEYERRVLEGLAYGRGGGGGTSRLAARLDLDASTATRRDPIRWPTAWPCGGELGIADGDLMLVVSTMHLPFVRRSHLVHMLEVAAWAVRCPGVHVVVKQHPWRDVKRAPRAHC